MIFFPKTFLLKINSRKGFLNNSVLTKRTDEILDSDLIYAEDTQDMDKIGSSSD